MFSTREKGNGVKHRLAGCWENLTEATFMQLCAPNVMKELENTRHRRSEESMCDDAFKCAMT